MFGRWTTRAALVGLLVVGFSPFWATPAVAAVPCGGPLNAVGSLKVDNVGPGQGDGYHLISNGAITHTLVSVTGAANLIVYDFSVGCTVVLCSKTDDAPLKQCNVGAGHQVVEVSYQSSPASLVEYVLKLG